MLPDEVPEIYCMGIFSSAKAFNTPMCAAPFAPPP